MESQGQGVGRGLVRNTHPSESSSLRRPGMSRLSGGIQRQSSSPSHPGMSTLSGGIQRMSLGIGDHRANNSGYKGTGDVGSHSWQNQNASNSEKTTLNPFASEFVPRFMAQVPVTTVPANDVYYPPPVTNGDSWPADGYDQCNGDSSESSKRSEPDDFVALNELKEFIDLISSQPAQYEAQLPFITDVLNNWIEEDEDIIMYCVVNTIIDQAIMDPNFRYNGVRLCIHLMENLGIRTNNGSFKDLLLQRCQREHYRRESLAVASDGGAYLRGVTLLIADLALRSIDSSLATEVPDLITTLMDHPTTDNLKCCCQVLKLCGPTFDVTGQTEVMDKIMERLQTFVNENTAMSSIKQIISNVIDLRKNGWKTTPVATMASNPYAAGDGADVVFGDFNPGHDASPSPAYYFGPCGDEQDTDVCDAFDEFLRASGQLQ